MKKRLLTIFAIVGATSLNAQVQRTPFIEHFTQASCGPCASQNPTMYTTLDNFGSANYVKVTHQVSWPGFDPMYNDFPIGPDARVSYYSVSGVPDCSLNGGATASPNTAVTTTTLNNMAAQTTAYAVTVDHVWNTANDITVNVNVTNTTGATVSTFLASSGTGVDVIRLKRATAAVGTSFNGGSEGGYPWNTRFDYTMNLSKHFDTEQQSDTSAITHGIAMRGGGKLFSNWTFDVTTGYDLKYKEFTPTAINVHWDLHCWELSLNWTPGGIGQGVYFKLNVKSPTLKDLKLEKKGGVYSSSPF